MRKITQVILVLIISLNFFCSTVFAQEITSDDLEKISATIQIITENYKEEVSKELLITGAIKGMLSSLDPYSTYFTKEEFKEFEESTNGEYSGIGINIKKVGKYIEVTGLIGDSPAKKAGLKVGDKFIEVDNASVVNTSLELFISKVKGLKGTNVNVAILREGSKKLIYFNIVRDIVKIPVVEYKIIDNSIGYIKISEFSKNCSDEVYKALEDFDKNNITKVIIDLRGNPGGLLNEAVSICENFIPKGPIVHVNTNDSQKTYYSKLERIKYKVAVLVDGGSASASEIFAGAVKDTSAGVIIGTNTYGKGTVQTIYELNDGSFIKLTIANYLTPLKKSVENVGVVPDIIIRSVNLESVEDIASLSIKRSITAGQRGEDVLAIEQRLKVLGYDILSPDYYYDSVTQKAILQYKKEHKIVANKVITKNFQRILNQEVITNFNKDAQILKALETLK